MPRVLTLFLFFFEDPPIVPWPTYQNPFSSEWNSIPQNPSQIQWGCLAGRSASAKTFFRRDNRGRESAWKLDWTLLFPACFYNRPGFARIIVHFNQRKRTNIQKLPGGDSGNWLILYDVWDLSFYLPSSIQNSSISGVQSWVVTQYRADGVDGPPEMERS